MFRLIVTTIAVGVVSFATPAHGQAGPTLELNPETVPLGGLVELKGEGFEPGIVEIYLDEVKEEPLAVLDHTGQFNFRVEISGGSFGAHKLIACNNISRTGVCREEASAALTITDPAPTTTTGPTSVTTSPPPTTTPPIATIAPTTIGGVAVATTTATPSTIDQVIGVSIRNGPDPTFNPIRET